MKHRTITFSRTLVALIAIATMAVFAAPADAVVVNPSGSCTSASCDIILDNVTNPPGFTGGPSNTTKCESDPAKKNEWHFVINQLNPQGRSGVDVTPPNSITALFLNPTTNEIAFMDANKDPSDMEVGYTLAGVHLTDTLLGAFATISGAPGVADANLWGGQFLLSHAPCGDGGGGGSPTSSVVTDIHREPGHTVVTSVTMGATIHDKATVTVTNGLVPAGSTVTFTLYRSGNCTGTIAAGPELVNLTGGSASEAVESSSYLVKAADIPSLSYKAIFSGGGAVPGAEAACEPLDVKSSITRFSYSVTGGASSPQPGPFSCTLETSTDTDLNNVPDLCAPGRPAADVTVSTRGVATSDYLVTVTAANNTGVNIKEKVQGGLAANATYVSPTTGILTPVMVGSRCQVTIPATDITAGCGAAILGWSAARGTNPATACDPQSTSQGNVVIWGDGTAATNQQGFLMSNGQVCTLQVIVRKGFSSTQLQAVTSSWSEVQTLVDGPNANFSEKSPYTGSLASCVHASNGSVTATRNTCNQ